MTAYRRLYRVRPFEDDTAIGSGNESPQKKEHAGIDAARFQR